MKLAWHPLWVSALGLGVGSLVLARNNPAGSLSGDSSFAGLALVAAGWATAGTGLLSWRRPAERRFGVLLFASGSAWFIAEWNNPGAHSSFVFTVGLVLYAACPPLIAHAALSYPSGHLASRLELAVVAAAYASGVGMLGLGSALFFAPRDVGCSQCPANLVMLTGDSHVVASLTRNGVRVGVGWTIAFVVLAVWRLGRATPAAKRRKAPVVVPALVYAYAGAANYVHALNRGFVSNDAFARRLWLVQAGALMLLAAGVAEARVRTRRTRAAIARLVVELDAAAVAGGLGNVLATMLRDPTLEVAFPIADGQHVDSRGQLIAMANVAGRATTAVVSDSETIALLTHRADLLGDRRLVEEVAGAARLGLENERLHAETRAQLAEMRTAGARLVAASDAERRRLERDLHDGAQQRLVGLTLALGRARRQFDATLDRNVVGHVEDAESNLRCAIAELRELATGMHPAVLTDWGFAAALQALAEGGTVQVRVASAPAERLPGAVETAAYLIVVEAAKLGPVCVSAGRRASSFVLDVDAAGPPDALVELADRVAALDGTLAVEPTSGGGVRIRAEIPCG